MEKYQISIIMPSLNVVNYIEECLLSVCHQTFTNIEILCVDAGSTDGTEQILKKYALEDSRIKFIHSSKKSYGYQVNIGVQEAKGKYIAILETDDYVDIDMYAILYQIAEKTECDYVKANFHYYCTFSDGERFFRNSDTLFYDKNSYNTVLNLSDHLELIQYDTNVWSGIYRRDFLLKNKVVCNESSGAAFQDIGFLQTIFWKARTAYYVNNAFYNYCTDREDSSTNKGNGLRFAYQEYQRLLSDEIYSNIDRQRVNCIYERMSDVFEENLKKALLHNKEDENTDIIEWFIDILTKKEKGGIIQREYLKCIREEGRAWIEKIKQQLTQEKIYRENMLKQLEGKAVVIFGAGSRGQSAYRNLDLANIKVMGFCDNNKALWGKKIGSKTINSIMDALKMWHHVKYVIANKEYYHEMELQLIEMEVQPDNIVIWK